ncbi:hypothetical protein [Providencia rettgeri]|uniref:hypothetical protein n=1 Tax=Providencia rettgeri TaxID=587 RepID=UPI00352504FB
MKKKLYLFGFDDGYDVYHINELFFEFNIKTYNIPKIIIFLIYKIPFLSPLVEKILSLHLSLFLKKCDHEGYYLFIDKPAYLRVYNLCKMKRKAIILRNTIDPERDNTQFLINQLCFSFDKGNCKNYGFKYYNQYTNLDLNLLPKKTKIEHDFYFLGLDKGRVDFVNKIQSTNKLNNKNLKFKVIFKSRPSNLIEKIQAKYFRFKKFKLLSYTENLSFVANSRVILDIVKSKQTGITLRSLEALVYNKKLVTNNKNIVNYEFYDAKNILILEDPSKPVDSEFIYSDVNKINTEILSKFGVIPVFKKIVSEIDAYYK